MRIFECENCHSVFIVNDEDERVKSGDYFIEESYDCPQCRADMTPVNKKEDET